MENPRGFIRGCLNGVDRSSTSWRHESKIGLMNNALRYESNEEKMKEREKTKEPKPTKMFICRQHSALPRLMNTT